MALPITKELIGKHVQILGSTGGGKTSIGLFTAGRQVIVARWGAVIIIDCGGDMAFFNYCRREAAWHRRRLLFVSTRKGDETFAVNPFLQSSLEGLGVADICDLVLNSLNLYHGVEWSRGYYSAVARDLLRSALEFHVTRTLPLKGEKKRQEEERLRRLLPHGIQSYRDLGLVVRALCKSRRDWQDANHLVMLVESIGESAPFNACLSQKTPREVLEHAVHFPDVIANKDVVYFFIPGGVTTSTAAELARLVVYSLFQACVAHTRRTGVEPYVTCIIDEAQVVLSASSIARVLTDSRKFGLGLVLAYQSRDQLNIPGGPDLRSIIDENTAIKWVFDIRSRDEQKRISEMSGQVAYADLSWHQVAGDDELSPARAIALRDLEPALVSVRERIGPRVTLEEIEWLSRDPNRSLLRVEQQDGVAHYAGWVPLFTPWLMTREEYVALKRTPWPSGEPGTMVVHGDWKVNRDLPADEPRPARPAFDPRQALDDIRRRLS